MKKENKLEKIIVGVNTFLLTGLVGSNVFAENIEITSNGGKIRESVLGKGIYNLIMDLSGTLRWLIPVTSIFIILWFTYKFVYGEENEQPRYKKRLMVTLAAVVGSTLASIIVNLILNYFKYEIYCKIYEKDK